MSGIWFVPAPTLRFAASLAPMFRKNAATSPFFKMSIFPASALVIAVAKFGSLPSVSASSFRVSSAAGDEATSAAIAALTKAVVTSSVLFTVCAGVGAVGVPVSAGLARYALSASTLLMPVATA